MTLVAETTEPKTCPVCGMPTRGVGTYVYVNGVSYHADCYQLPFSKSVEPTKQQNDLIEAQAAELATLRAKVAELEARTAAAVDALRELHAIVCGECPSLLNEDSGGNGDLSIQIDSIINGEMA